MANQEFQKATFEQSISAVGITMETRLFKLLHKHMQLQPPKLVLWIG